MDHGAEEGPDPGAAPGAACPVGPGPAAVTVGASPPPSVGGGGGGAPVSLSAFIRSRAR